MAWVFRGRRRETVPRSSAAGQGYSVRVRPRIHQLARDPERDEDETSAEPFDRMRFAERALALVRPANTRVALIRSRARVVVEMGRAWGRSPDARWAMVAVPPNASRRAIAMAVVALAGPAREPYALDVLLAEIDGDGRDLAAE